LTAMTRPSVPSAAVDPLDQRHAVRASSAAPCTDARWRSHAAGGTGPSNSWRGPRILPAPKLWLAPKFSIHCLRKMSKFDVTSCQILRLKCLLKFHFRWGDYSPPRNLVAAFKRAYLQGDGGGEGRGTEGKRKGRGGGQGRKRASPQYFGLEPPLLADSEDRSGGGGRKRSGGCAPSRGAGSTAPEA